MNERLDKNNDMLYKQKYCFTLYQNDQTDCFNTKDINFLDSNSIHFSYKN